MNILFLVSSLQGGGAERVAATVANAWVERGYSVTLMPTFSGRGDCHYVISSDVVVDYLADHVNGNKGKLQRMWALRRYVLGNRPDVIVSFLPNVNIAALIATIGTSVPVIACERVFPPIMLPPLSPILKLARKYLYPRAAFVGVQTAPIGAWVDQNIPGSRVKVIANPIVLPLPITPPKLPPEKIVSASKKIVLGVGRFHRSKRFDLIIRAFGQCSDQAQDWDLVLLGDGEERPALHSLIKTLGLTDRVHMPGISGNVTDWYRRADIFAMASQNEGFPNALLEAMAHDLPTISFDILTGPSELTDGGRRGILLPDQGHVSNMANAFESLIHDGSKRAALAAKAGEVRDVYSLEEIMTQWDACLEAAVGTSRPV